MKSFTVAALVFFISSAVAFQQSALPSTTRQTLTTRSQYIPDGFTKESYAKFKAEEAKKAAAAKNLGAVGPKGFKSRSFQAFQEALERGESGHLFPVLNAKERVKKGELKVEDIPYMQRGGAWDNSDIKGAAKKRWLNSDKEYENGGMKRSASVSILGTGEGLDWTGQRNRSGPAAQKKKNDNDKPQPKKLFGLF